MPDNDLSSELMTVEELAAYTKLSPGTIYNRIGKGTIPVVRLGRTVRFRRSEIDAWMVSHREEQADGERVRDEGAA